MLSLTLPALRICAGERRLEVTQDRGHPSGDSLGNLGLAGSLLATLDGTPTRCPLVGR